jgi:hypothetical protein
MSCKFAAYPSNLQNLKTNNMFEQIKHNMETIAGGYLSNSVIINFFFFLRRIGIWVFRIKKEQIDELSQMPLNDK